MAEKDTHSQAERRERSKTNYYGIEGLIQRLIDAGEPEERVEETTKLLLTKAMQGGITLESLVEAYIDTLQSAKSFESSMEQIRKVMEQ